MRNISLLKHLVTLFMSTALFFVSCQDKTEEIAICTITSSDIDLTINPSKITVPADGKSYKLQVDISGDVTWTAQSSNTDVATVSKTTIQNVSGELVIYVEKNTTYSSRTSIISISSPALVQPTEIHLFQPEAGAPVINKTLKNGKDALNISGKGDTLSYEIVSNPVTTLTYEINPAATAWLSLVTGKTTEWAFAPNNSFAPRSSWICIKYNNGQKSADTIRFTQKGSTLTPAVTIADEDRHSRMVTLRWATTDEILATLTTIRLVVGDPNSTPFEIPVEKGMLRLGLSPDSQYEYSATAITKNGDQLEASKGVFFSKKTTDTYLFKDQKMKENLASWLSAKRSKNGTALNNNVYLVNGGISYDTLEMVDDLKLTNGFGQAAGMEDLLQCKNLKNLQLGRGYNDEGIGFDNIPKFKEYLQAVLTKSYFSSFSKIGIGKGATGVSANVKTAVKEVCSANSITFVDEMDLAWPNEVRYTSNTIQTMSSSVSDMKLFDRSRWQAVSWSTSQPSSEGIASLFDANFNSCWHTQKNNDPNVTLPHTFVIDFREFITFNTIVMADKIDGSANSRPYVYTVEFGLNVSMSLGNPGDISAAEPTGWTWSNPIQIVNNPSANSIATSVNTNSYTLPSAVTARCIRVKITVVNQFPNNNACSFSEFGVNYR